MDKSELKNILVDVHEPEKVINSIKENYHFISVQKTALPVGDIWLQREDDLLIIERKTVSDMLSSIADGRLKAQVHEALQLTSLVVVMVEGFLTQTDDGYAAYNIPSYTTLELSQRTGWTMVSVQGMLTLLQRMGAVVRFYERDAGKEVQSINAIMGKDIRVRQRASVTVETAEEALLASLPGIGAKKATDIWNRHHHLGSALAYLTSLDKMTDDVPGIGLKTRRKVHDFMGGQIMTVNEFNQEVLGEKK